MSRTLDRAPPILTPQAAAPHRTAWPQLAFRACNAVAALVGWAVIALVAMVSAFGLPG